MLFRETFRETPLKIPKKLGLARPFLRLDRRSGTRYNSSWSSSEVLERI